MGGNSLERCCIMIATRGCVDNHQMVIYRNGQVFQCKEKTSASIGLHDISNNWEVYLYLLLDIYKVEIKLMAKST